MKVDEIKFIIELYKASLDLIPVKILGYIEDMQPRLSPREIINQDGFTLHHKRAWYLLDKWCNKGWYDYGVTLDLGWLTDIGKQKALELMAL